MIKATTTGTMQAEGTHTPAMLAEVLKRLIHDPSGVYVDGTFGRGGHSRAILQNLSPDGRLHSFDIDEEAVAVGKKLMEEDPRFTIHHRWFGDMHASRPCPCARCATCHAGLAACLCSAQGVSG